MTVPENATYKLAEASYILQIVADEIPEPTAIDQSAGQRNIRKEVVNGQLVILIDGVRYKVLGQAL